MKKLFTLTLSMLSAVAVMAQMHGEMKFVGGSSMTVMNQTTQSESDTISFAMSGSASGSVTFPTMKGMSTIPSFTVSDVAFSMGDNHQVVFADQTFSATVLVDGVEKSVKGSSLSGTYNPADNTLSLKAVFQYGSMPFLLTYEVNSYYVKPVSNPLNVTVGGVYSYSNESVTYNVRKYKDGDVEKLDVEVPAYSLQNTVMGDLTLGTYVVKGLEWDSEKGGYYRDYKNDGLSFHFKAVKDGTTSMDGDYQFNAAKENNILVKYDGTQITSIVNTFQMGAMPFGIVSTFGQTANGIGNVVVGKPVTDGKVYNLAGQRVADNAKGLVIVNGKKVVIR